MKKHFVLHLLPPRPSFAQDMTPEERAIMKQHVAYWTNLMHKGFVLAFGPVMDPKGVYGLGLVAVDDPAQVNDFIAGDPATAINRYEVFPMMAVTPANEPKGF